MLKRDLPNDYCEKYFEEVTKQSFFRELQTGNSRDHLYLTEQQFNMLELESKKAARIIQGLVPLSLLGFIVLNKLPLMRSIHSRFLRGLTKIGVLVGPVYGVANLQIENLQKVKNMVFEEQASKYKEYLRCGEIKKLNEKVEFTEE